MNARPMSIVEDKPLQKILRMLHASVSIPSARTVTRDIMRVFDFSKAHVIKTLAAAPGRKHTMLDGWSSPNVLSVLGIMVTYFDGEKMVTTTLDCVRYVLLFIIIFVILICLLLVSLSLTLVFIWPKPSPPP